MTLSFKDLEFRTEVPDIPRSLPVTRTIAQCEPERSRSVRALADHFMLSDVIEVGLPWGYALGNDAGQVEFFSASGGVRGRNLKVINAFDDERRHWQEAMTVDSPSGPQWVLGEKSSRELIRRSRGLLERLELTDEPASTDVTLGQWALLDEEGNERDSGPGRATVQLSYAFEKLPFIGPGSKTLLHYDPTDLEPQLARLFHVHRSVGDARSVDVGDTERAFAALLADPFLVTRVRRPAKVAITSVKVGLLALPADVVQMFAIPSLAVEGAIEGLIDPKGQPFELRFGRYVPVVSSDELHRAGVAAASEMPGSAVGPRGKSPAA
jgi:hypothetical protein